MGLRVEFRIDEMKDVEISALQHELVYFVLQASNS